MAMTATLLTKDGTASAGGPDTRIYVISATLTTDTQTTIQPLNGTTTPIVPRAWQFTPAVAYTDATAGVSSALAITLNATTGVLTLTRAGGAGGVTSADTTIQGIGRLLVWDSMNNA